MTHYRALAFKVVLAATVALSVGFGTATVAGQSAGAEQFNETYGGSAGDGATSVVQTSDGGYAFVGSTESFGSGSGDAWLIKTDANGNVEINKTYGGTGDDNAESLVQTSDGGYAITGITRSFGSGSGDAWLIKTDANGAEQFNVTFGGSGLDKANSGIQTFSGGYAIAGSTNSFGSGFEDAWLIKTDANGAEQFNVTFGGSDFDEARSVVQTVEFDPRGNLNIEYALAGETRSFGSGKSDAWLIQTDGNGNEIFNKTFGGSGSDEASSLVVSNGYALAGETVSFGNDAWLIKTDPSGNEVFNETFGGTSSDTAYSVVKTQDGGFALAGQTSSFSSGGPFSDNAWLIKTNLFGIKQFSETFGETNLDTAQSVVQTQDGGYALAGLTASFGSVSDDAWLIKVSGENPFTQPLISRFNSPPTNTGNLDGALYEDLSGDGDGTDVTQTVAVIRL